MKSKQIYLVALAATAVLISSSCKKNFVDINTDPNHITAANINYNYLFTNAQLITSGNSDANGYEDWRNKPHLFGLYDPAPFPPRQGTGTGINTSTMPATILPTGMIINNNSVTKYRGSGQQHERKMQPRPTFIISPGSSRPSCSSV